MPKHLVRLCRPRFEVVVIEIEAADDDRAKALALAKAEHLPQSAWHLQRLDEENYSPHVESCYSDHTIDANVGEDEEERAEFVEELLSPEPTEETRYLLLLGDIGSGEGKVIFEPWFAATDPGLLEIDITGDWAHELTEVVRDGLERFDPDDEEQPKILHPFLEALRPKPTPPKKQ